MKRREFLGASGAGLIVASTARATTILDTSGKLIESMTASTSRGDITLKQDEVLRLVGEIP